MGQSMPSAVSSVLVRRCAGRHFRFGAAEVNGWRSSMEDAHVCHFRENWGFFGVFDGHGGDKCSKFLARRLPEALEAKGPPRTEAEWKGLALGLDAEFLASGESSGSTAAMVFAEANGDHFHVQVGNVGDSRVLLGRADGTMATGRGTDGALTRDHNPSDADELARVMSTGGFVRDCGGTPRVNGTLAMSRAFGDASYKETGGPSLEDRPVCAVPEVTQLQCDPNEFLLLVCDGVSEGNFPNRNVVRFAHERLSLSQSPPDPGEVAAAVCQEALRLGSKDNISCLVVLFGPEAGTQNGDVAKPLEFIPGPFASPDHEEFRETYAAAARHAGLTLPQALDLRCQNVQSNLRHPNSSSFSASELRHFRDELGLFGGGPPAGSDEEARIEWFQRWLKDRAEDGRQQAATASDQLNMLASGQGGDQPAGQFSGLLGQLLQNPQLFSLANSQLSRQPPPTPPQPPPPPSRRRRSEKRVVGVAAAELLWPAVQQNPNLAWDEVLWNLCGRQGELLYVDDSDGTSEVDFADLGVTAWLPTAALIDITISVSATAAELEAALASHETLEWQEGLRAVCGQEGVLLDSQEDSCTAQVRLPRLGLEPWLPRSCLTERQGSQPTLCTLEVSELPGSEGRVHVACRRLPLHTGDTAGAGSVDAGGPQECVQASVSTQEPAARLRTTLAQKLGLEDPTALRLLLPDGRLFWPPVPNRGAAARKLVVEALRPHDE